jgi:hypothetical protein
MKTETQKTKTPKRVVGRRLIKGLPLNKDIFSFEGEVNVPSFSYDRTTLVTKEMAGFFQVTRKYNAMRVNSTTRANGYVVTNLQNGRQETVYEPENSPLRVKLLKKEEENYKELQKVASLRVMRSNPGIVTGADPEIFFETKDTKEVVPAWTLFAKRGRLTGDVMLYPDGFQAEWNVAAATCLDQVASSIERSMSIIRDTAARHQINVSQNTVMPVSQEAMDKAPEEWAMFGCTPSMNAYGEELTIPDGRTVPFRSAGGHIHYGMHELKGTSPEAEEARIKTVKALDKVIGVACVWFFREYDHPARRQFYGRAGEYRAPKHGLEYRTLSNAWLINRVVMHLVLELARKCVISATQKIEFNPLDDWKATEKETRDCINNTDPHKALEILQRNKAVFLSLLGTTQPGSWGPGRPEELWNMWIAGARCVDKGLKMTEKDKWRHDNAARNVSGFLHSDNYKNYAKALFEKEVKEHTQPEKQKKAA